MWRLKHDSKPRKVIDETQLSSYEKEDAYERKRWVLNTVAVVLAIAIAAIPVIIAGALLFSADMRTKIMAMVVNNLPGLLYAGIIILGIKFISPKQ